MLMYTFICEVRPLPFCHLHVILGAYIIPTVIFVICTMLYKLYPNWQILYFIIELLFYKK